jgi:hypothetical protein
MLVAKAPELILQRSPIGSICRNALHRRALWFRRKLRRKPLCAYLRRIAPPCAEMSRPRP